MGASSFSPSPITTQPSIETVRIVCDDPDAATAAYAPLSALADGVYLTRDLVSEPANILYPAEFARRVKARETLGLTVEVLGEAEMGKLSAEMGLPPGMLPGQ